MPPNTLQSRILSPAAEAGVSMGAALKLPIFLEDAVSRA